MKLRKIDKHRYFFYAKVILERGLFLYDYDYKNKLPKQIVVDFFE